MGDAILLVVAVIYVLPTVMVWASKHRNRGPITAVNLLLGWTIIGWVVAFAWALSDPRPIAHR
jgi:hypothetical protein